jgi:hypothetical protein
VFNPLDTNRHFNKVTELIDKQRLNMKEEKDLLPILHIVSSVVFQNFINKTSRKLSDEEAMNDFVIQMDLIKHGIYRKG